ncbi:hypothetical protein P3L10_015318 [Capsicum annuum]
MTVTKWFVRCSKYEKIHPTDPLSYAQGKTVTQVTLAHLKDTPTQAQPQSSSTLGVSSSVRPAVARLLGVNGSKTLSFVGQNGGSI